MRMPRMTAVNQYDTGYCLGYYYSAGLLVLYVCHPSPLP